MMDARKFVIKGSRIWEKYSGCDILGIDEPNRRIVLLKRRAVKHKAMEIFCNFSGKISNNTCGIRMIIYSETKRVQPKVFWYFMMGAALRIHREACIHHYFGF